MASHPSQSLWAVPVAQMAARAGSSMQLHRVFPAPEGIGDSVIGVKPGSDVTVDGNFDSVVDGLMFQGTITARVHAECSRCLMSLHRDWSVDVCAFFAQVESKGGARSNTKSNRANGDNDDLEDADIWDEGDDSGNVYPLVGGGDFADIEALIRDTMVSELPLKPLCEPDCKGLCSQCGENLNEHPDHHHDITDIRFAALEGLKAKLEAQQSA
ncbi:YceD family protein [Gardnerella vaginalis]|uniref:YceD family protein n=1 Tax=Gardnerella vaginalis TaxID=2702 RepID=UPI0039EE7BF5